MAETADPAPERTATTPRRAAGNGSSRSRSSRARPRADDLEAQVASLQSDLRAITQTLARMGESRVNDARSTARTEVQNLMQRGQEAVEGAQDEFGQLERQLKDTIREKPLTAVAGAVALGFLIAVITR